MFAYLALLTICGFFLVLSIKNLLHRRFLHPADLAILSIFYYAVPLSIAGFFSWNPRGLIFLHRAAADPDLAFRSLVYATAAIACLQIGRKIGEHVPSPQLNYYFEISASSEGRARLAFAALIGMVGIGIPLFGIPEFLAGYATSSYTTSAALGNAMIYFGVESLGLCIAYALLVRRVLNRNTLLVLILVALVCIIFVLAIRAKRLEAVSAMLPMAIILLSSRSSITLATWRIGLGAAAIAALIAVSVLRIGDIADSFTVAYYAFSEGLYAGHSLPGIEGRLEANLLAVEYGARYLSSVLGFIPRFLWEGKDDMVYAGNMALNGVSPLGATSFLAEVVLQGRIVAVVATYSIMGYVFERLTKFEQVWDAGLTIGKLPLRFFGYLAAIAIFVPHFRDGIIPSVKLVLQSIAFLALLAGVHSIAARRRKAST